MKTKIFSMLALSIASLSAAQASTVTAWNFDNDAVAKFGPSANGPAASTGTGTTTSLGMNLSSTNTYGSDVLAGVAADTGANTLSDLTNVWRIRGTTANNGWTSTAAIGTQGAEFAASTLGYSNINVSFDWYTTTQGEANLQLEYTNDGTHWINDAISIGANSSLGLASLTNSSSTNTVNGAYISDNLLTNGSLAGQDWFTNLTASISDPLAANNALFAIKLVNASTGVDNVSTQGTALNNTSGNWRFDNVSISGTAISAVPVPGAVWLFGSALAGFLGLSRRKSV